MADTNKPEGVKRARATMTQIATEERAEVEIENCLTAYFEVITKRAKIGYYVMSEGGKRTEAIQYNVRVVEAVNDDALLSKDISQMDDQAK